MLLDYQVSFIQNVKAIVENNWLRKKPPLRVLDMGCETSGRQLSEIAKLTSGEVVGVNVAAGFPDSNAIQVAGGQVRLLNMSGLDLKFPDESFDLVVSANVLEHVPCPNIFIKEAARVLKPSGICWMETAPVWTSARGHHVMKSMVDQSCPWERGFSDDGSIIPDWSHLKLNRREMGEVIGEKVRPATREWILSYLYDSGDLNKTPMRELEASLLCSFPFVRLQKNKGAGFDNRLTPDDSLDDYSIVGFSACCRKRNPGWFIKRACWRLRRMGL